jgi:hypothetical protein
MAIGSYLVNSAMTDLILAIAVISFFTSVLMKISPRQPQPASGA